MPDAMTLPPLLPDHVRASLHQSLWTKRNKMRDLLTGDHAFPLVRALRPPNGPALQADPASFRAFIDAWRAEPLQAAVQWETRGLQGAASQEVPTHLRLRSMEDLAQFLGPEACRLADAIHARIQPLAGLDSRTYSAAAHIHADLLAMGDQAFEQLLCLLPQMQAGMGRGRYLRELPLHSAGTKFIESNERIVTVLMDAITDGEVSNAGSLLAWLGCHDKPSGWLLIRALDDDLRGHLMGAETLRMASADIGRYGLPCERVLVVENDVCAYSLPQIKGCMAVAGTGGNLQWLAAQWVKAARVGYWGDMDTWGFVLLDRALGHAPHITPLMMDGSTLDRYSDRAVYEEAVIVDALHHLPTDEAHALCVIRGLARGASEGWRLEQEKLDGDFVHERVRAWASSQGRL
jgi:hypothetical protein